MRAVRRAQTMQDLINPLYRKPSKKELKSVEPERELFVKYAAFLRAQKTGLTKLIDDKGCSANIRVVVATEDCLKYTMPGAGSSFSFRTENYCILRFADVTFAKDGFQAGGALIHGIFVELGDVPLANVDLRTKGLKYLVDFQPEPDYEEGIEMNRQLTQGIVSDDFLYRRSVPANKNTTFALRSIAYDGKSLRAIRGVIYNEFDFDKREDVIVVFRIVQKDEQGDVTILWKELQQKDSPKIRRKDEDN